MLNTKPQSPTPLGKLDPSKRLKRLNPMKLYLDPDKTLGRNALVLILSLAVLMGLMVTALHIFIEPNPHPLSRIMPPLLTLLLFLLLVQLLRKPQQALIIFQIGFLTLWAINLLPAWLFPLVAAYHNNIQLIETLPPISSFLFLLTTGLVIFVHPNKVVNVALCAWISIALPSLVYLITHPMELGTERGLDLFISLGPAMAVNMAMIFFYSRLQCRLQELKIERAQFKHLSERDHLTGLYNRATGEQILQSHLQSMPQSIGVILFDVDHFKAINDTHGHTTGDMVLRELTQRCLSRLRGGDVLVRWGGEEFLAIVSNVTMEQTYLVAEQLRRVISQRPIGNIDRVTASFGMTSLQLEDTAKGLLERVDKALYTAKKEGRNRVILDRVYSFNINV